MKARSITFFLDKSKVNVFDAARSAAEAHKNEIMKWSVRDIKNTSHIFGGVRETAKSDEQNGTSLRTGITFRISPFQSGSVR